MKKLVLFLAILFVSVLCTACINNVAIQELNNRAQEYMQKGDVKSAICRLESSVDLDGSVFETRYNLGVAYISAEDFKKAQTHLEEAVKLKPDFANAHYSLAIAYEGDGQSVLEEKDDDESSVVVEVVEEDDNVDVKSISQDEAQHLISKLTEAIESYEKYLQLSGDNEDGEDVQKQILYLQETIDKYSKKYEIEQ